MQLTHTRFLFYAVCVIVIALAFLRMESIADAQRTLSQVKTNELCQSSNENRRIIRTLATGALDIDHVLIERHDPPVRDYLRDRVAEREALLAEIQEDLAAIECPPLPESWESG